MYIIAGYTYYVYYIKIYIFSKIIKNSKTYFSGKALFF
jgi:hypothetical protein